MHYASTSIRSRTREAHDAHMNDAPARAGKELKRPGRQEVRFRPGHFFFTRAGADVRTRPRARRPTHTRVRARENARGESRGRRAPRACMLLGTLSLKHACQIWHARLAPCPALRTRIPAGAPAYAHTGTHTRPHAQTRAHPQACPPMGARMRARTHAHARMPAHTGFGRCRLRRRQVPAVPRNLEHGRCRLMARATKSLAAVSSSTSKNGVEIRANFSQNDVDLWGSGRTKNGAKIAATAVSRRR